MGNAGRVLMIPKGDYNAATTYQMLDFVYYQGRSYVCKQTSTGNAPTNTTYWQALTGDASAEIQALTNYVNEAGAHNIMPFTVDKVKAANTAGTWSGNVYTYNTVTFTLATDAKGNITKLTINGTAPVATTFGVTGQLGAYLVQGESYYLNGTPNPYPTGGELYLSQSPNIVDDASAEGVLFTYDGITNREVKIYCDKDVPFNNVEYLPMIRLASDAGTTYQPYAKTNVELTQDVAVKTGSFAAETGINASKLEIKQCGHVVTFNGYLTGVTTQANTETSLGTYSGVSAPPSGAPVRCLGGVASAAYHSTSEVIYVSIGDDRTLLVRTPSAQTSKAVYFSCSYIV